MEKYEFYSFLPVFIPPDERKGQRKDIGSSHGMSRDYLGLGSMIRVCRSKVSKTLSGIRSLE